MPHTSSATMPVERPWHRTHLAVPRSDGTLLTVPDLDEAGAAAWSNRDSLERATIDVQGRPLNRIRHWARGEAVRLATSYTQGRLGDSIAAADPAAPLIVPGHQPALYHPGVWAKNFAAAGIAQRTGGAVLNLVVDNDLYTRPAIEIPTGTREEPGRKAIAFDLPQRARPWEGSRVLDPVLFSTFGERVASAMERWNLEPLIAGYWSQADKCLAGDGDLPDGFTAVRHDVESTWGVHNLELRMSELCGSDPFLWMTAHLFAQLPRFADVYNGVLSEYRGLYRIKSRNHPVPALEVRDDWTEAPFWVWRDDAPLRRRVFARQSGRQILLSDDAGQTFATLPLTPTMEACCAVEVLRTLPDQGIRLRTRALTTTLFARLFLADLFVHGIGGAKYDEMTDRIIARFFEIAAPEYATVSASLFLPFAEPFDVQSDDERRLLALLRDLEENPQRHLVRGHDPALDGLIDEKARLIAEQDDARPAEALSRSCRRARSATNARRFAQLQAVTDRLAAYVAGQRDQVRQELASVRRQLKANRILTSREFSFALYPGSKLEPFLTGLASTPGETSS